MTGSRTKSGSGSRSKAGGASSGQRRKAAKGTQPAPSDYAREAITEWGKAARYGAAALAPVARSGAAAARELVGSRARGNGATPTDEAGAASPLEAKGPDKDDAADGPLSGIGERFGGGDGGKVGELADAALAKFGAPGKLASKAHLGSRAVGRAKGRAGKLVSSVAPSPRLLDGTSGPIQESIEVAVPARVAYALATRIEEFPEYLDRVEGAERSDDQHGTVDATTRGSTRTVELELLDAQPPERLEWRAHGEIEHVGAASFHELEPTLTQIELAIEPQERGVVRRLAQGVHLTERTIRSNLHRFKAYAEAQGGEAVEQELAEEDAKAARDEGSASDDQAPEDSTAEDAAEEERADDDDASPDEDTSPDDDEQEHDGDEHYPRDHGTREQRPASLLTHADPPQPEHAYSEVLEDYEPQDAYAKVLGEDEYRRIGERS